MSHPESIHACNAAWFNVSDPAWHVDLQQTTTQRQKLLMAESLLLAATVLVQSLSFRCMFVDNKQRSVCSDVMNPTEHA
jgi:hypothetical protein